MYFGYLVEVLETLMSPSIPFVPSTFLQLSIFTKIQVFLVLNMANVVVILLTLIGIAILVRFARKNKVRSDVSRLYMFIVAMVFMIWLFVAIQAVANFGCF